MIKNLHNSFSSSSSYLIIISGVTLAHCILWLQNNKFELRQRQGVIDFYQIKKKFKDQAQLISFIQEVYNYRFSIVSVAKKEAL